MNTLEDIINHGIDMNTAKAMIDSYIDKIGKMNGIYEISDINYDFTSKGKDITLKCSLCLNEIHRLLISGRNKWSELIKTCECQKEAKRLSILKNSEKIKRQKQELILERIGKQYGDFRIVSVDDISDNPKYTLSCSECGYERTVSANVFEQVKNFKCRKHYEPLVKYDNSYIGKKKNFLEVVDIARDGNGERRFACKCECGKIKLIQPCNWENETIKSCGCMRNNLLSESKTILIHNADLDRLRRIYNGMKQRCYNTNSDNYANYGGRGINICEKWLDNREAFIKWALNNGYSNDLSIDRINVNGNYEPSNCRWATDKLQRNNQRPRIKANKSKVSWTVNGTTLPARDWCKKYKISFETVSYRINHKEMTVLEALTTPKIVNGRPRKRCTS